jgi:hypothetical protein
MKKSSAIFILTESAFFIIFLKPVKVVIKQRAKLTAAAASGYAQRETPMQLRS